MVVDALSQKSMRSLAHIIVERRSLAQGMPELGDMGIWFEVDDTEAMLANFRVRSILMDHIMEALDKDGFMAKVLEEP